MDYLDWSSQLTPEAVFAAKEAFSYPHLLDDGSGRCLYLTNLEQQRGRSALMLLDDGNSRCITPAPFSCRTKVNEYGGKPFWVSGNELLFANQGDQRLYRQIITDAGVSEPVAVTPAYDDQALAMYTDVHQVGSDTYVAIIEREHSSSGEQENSMAICSIDARDKRVMTLIEGSNFYSNLVIDAQKSRIAWVQWQHPNMPWDEAELWVAELNVNDASVTLAQARRIYLSPGASVCQLLFAVNGKLFFSADFEGSTGSDDYWNVHVYDFSKDRVQRVTNERREYGYPHWVYGDHRIAQLDPTRLITIASDPEQDRLVVIDTESLVSIDHSVGSNTFQSLTTDQKGNALVLAHAPDRMPALQRMTFDGDSVSTSDLMTASMPVNDGVSVGDHFRFETQDGAHAYGFFYPPINNRCQDKTDVRAKPPLIVMVHGGPTARAYGYYDAQKQFWTSRGFALLDVNHRGSSGYGRSYRDSLYGQWGVLDCTDVIDGIRALDQMGKIDIERVCIRGKSAGGYAVLRALTEYPDQFRAGASYYGIGNLITLAETTHKFEKFYTDRLIGERALSPQSRYITRSPINKLDQLQSAMIVFQGLLDRVVPPSVAHEIINELNNAGIRHAYVEYPDEGHGFRQVTNSCDAWRKELDFYRDVLRHTNQ